MSKNTCPCCNGVSNYKDIPRENTEFLCCGCEIKYFKELHGVMREFKTNKENAFKIFKKKWMKEVGE